MFAKCSIVAKQCEKELDRRRLSKFQVLDVVKLLDRKEGQNHRKHSRRHHNISMFRWCDAGPDPSGLTYCCLMRHQRDCEQA